jgi:hypothetical protein
MMVFDLTVEALMSLGFLFLQVVLQSQSVVHVKIGLIDCSEFIHLMSGLWSL